VVIPILFENEDVCVVDKPEGLVSVPERRPQGESLVERLSAERGEKLYPVHRLDRETSGVIVFARHAHVHRRLNQQFEHRLVEKAYLALVHGVVIEDCGTVDEPLRQFGSGRVGVDPERGKASVTEFSVVERYTSFTLVEARPRTGRRHQIRVHLYHLGHPVVGDPLYGDKAKQRDFARLMLHARRIALSLPSGEDLAVEAPIPDSFSAVLTMAGQE
jgi:RluA family pseudouridine synthase